MDDLDGAQEAQVGEVAVRGALHEHLPGHDAQRLQVLEQLERVHATHEEHRRFEHEHEHEPNI